MKHEPFYYSRAETSRGISDHRLSSLVIRAATDIGTRIAEPTIMKFFCKHCDQIVIGKPYRVVSEDNGVILLNMTVCDSCHKQARALGLHSEAIQSDPYRREKIAFLSFPPALR